MAYFEGKKILVVDDEEGIRFLYKEVFEDMGFVVELAKNGKEALEKIPLFKPDLITLDIKMPVMDGIEALKEIRKMDRYIPVIICSAYGEYKVDFTLWASDAYCVKCQDLTELRHTIIKLISKNPQELEISRLSILANTLTAGNEALKRELELTRKVKDAISYEGLDQYKSILGAAVHSLKGEFMYIGNSIKILKELATSSSDIQEEVNMIERSMNYSQLVLRRLLDYLDIGKPPLTLVDIMVILRDAEFLVRPRLPSIIQLIVSIDHSTSETPSVLANAEQLIEVLIELINNATNALHEKGGVVELKLEEKNGKIAISVKDNGPGIPEEFKDDVFKKELSSKSGLGLGLFLCNKVIRSFEGELNMETSSDKGTIVTILLPLANNKKET
jgi:signal transduction histidine kinase